MKRLADTWKRIAGADSGPLRALESAAASLALAFAALLPTVEALTRALWGRSIYNSGEIVTHLVLWIALLGGMITSRERRHLSLSATVDALGERSRRIARVVTGFLSIFVCASLFFASLSFVLIGFDPTRRIGFVPITVATAVLPLGFAVVAVRFSRQLEQPRGKAVTILAAVILAIAFSWQQIFTVLRVIFPNALALDGIEFGVSDVLFPVLRLLHVPLIVMVILGAVFGLPLFAVLGGLALLLFHRSGGALEVIPNEAYTLLTGAVIPAIPLFTLTGFLLSEGRAADRLVRFFRGFFGWLKGGPVIVGILVCAFFTTFTGGSGVTILALGGLLSAVLLKSRYPKAFTTGILTAAGSVGLLFPPSLAVIMYGVTALISIKDLFIGGLLPGALLVTTLITVGLIRSRDVRRAETQEEPEREPILTVLRDSIWEILLPVIVLVSYFTGFTTLVETAALSVVYTFVIEVVVRRDLAVRDLPRVALRALPVIGGVMMILTVAKGFSFYIVDAQIPIRLTELMQQHVQSPYVFLILLNLALLITGCFMDIFSAILVVAPLVIPLGAAYGIHPVHLGVIFLANLELGYLTPPVGINLFLASYRFEEPVTRVYRLILPFLAVQLGGVLLVTYVPWLSTALVRLIGGG